MKKRMFFAIAALVSVTLSFAQEYMIFENINGGIARFDVSVITQGYFKTYEAAGAGTAENPFNVAGANAKCKEIGTVPSTEQYYVKGYVITFSNKTLYIADDMSGINRIYSDASIPASYELKSGDEVVVLGNLYNYNNLTPNIVSAQITSINGQTIELPKPQGSGTPEDPYNVQAISDIIKALAADTPLENAYYVKGVITNISDVSTVATYNNCTFNISDDIYGTNALLLYRCKGLGGKDITDENFIKVGDEVVIYSTSWVNYKGVTPETKMGAAYIYSINGNTSVASASPNVNKNTFGPAEAQYRLEFPKLKGGNSVAVIHRAVLNDKTKEEGVNYSVEWDTDLSSQRWSCYQLYNSISYNSSSNVARYYAENDGTLSPTCQYPNDPDLPEAYRFTEDPYKFSGYDHGHLCPSADRLRATECNYQTFYITNMQPQYNKFNAGLWAKMEEDVRNWVRLGDTLYVCKGGTIDKSEYILEYVNRNSHQPTRVNKNHIPVPRFFYMAIVCRKGDVWQGMAYWVQQYNEDHSNDNRKGYAITIDRLEELTSIDFFCNLPDDIEEQVEKEIVHSFWGLN